MAEHKYKVGEKVRVRPDLKCGNMCAIWSSKEMEKMAGKIVTIRSLNGSHEGIGRYSLEDDKGCWGWTEDMFIPVERRELKVGDKVRVRPDLRDGDKYDDCLAIGCMARLAGTIVTINWVKDINRYTIEEDPHALYWSSEMFILDESPEVESHVQSIIITSDGKKTTAVFKDGEKTREAFCRCSPSDTFDFAEGAKIAFSRFWEDDDDDNPAEEVGYDGKVICVQHGYGSSAPVENFTVGKIYTVTDGHIKGDRVESVGKYYSLEMLCIGMGHKFIPLVE